MKAVLHYRASPGFVRALNVSKPAWLQAVVVPEDDPAAFAREMRDADVLLHVLEPVTAAMMAGAPGLKLIQKIGVGVNTIDLDAARAQRIAVANMPGSNSQAVAELTLLLMLATLRRLRAFDALTREGAGWAAPLDLFDGLGEIAGRTVGFVGYGAIPARLAPALAALGAEVIYCSRSEKPDAVAARCSFDELLARADVISLHVPLTAETQGMINRETLAAMRPGAVLINTARGGLVDEGDLYAALTSGRLRGAGLDTFALEPVRPDNPLFGLDSVVVSPHIAWLTPETLDRSLGIAFENCRRLRDGAPLLHEIR